MKKLLSLLLCLALLLTSAGFTLAEEGEAVDVVVFNNGGGVTNGVASDPAVLKELQDWFVEQIGVRIEVIVPPADEAKTKLNLLLNSGEQLDAFWGSWLEYSALGMIRPITEFYSAEAFPGIEKEFGFAFAQMTDKDGEFWGIPRSFSTNGYPYLYRADWAEAVGITEKPRTMEELNTLLYAVQKADPAGGGQTIPLVATNIANILQCMLGLYTDEGYSYWLDEDGKVKLYITQEGTRDAVAQIAQWYADGILYKDFNTLDTAALRELATTGRAFSSLQWYSAISMAWQNMYLADPATPVQGEYSFLTNGDGQTGSNTSNGGTNGLIFSANASDAAVDALLRLLDFELTDTEARFNATYGLGAWEYVPGSTETATPKEGATNTGTTSYNTEYRISIGQLRISEFHELLGANDDRYVASNGEQAGYFFYFLYMDHHYDVDNRKPFQYDYIFDTAKISEDVIAYTDVNTKIDEELYKFVTGARPMAEWDAFISELYAMGMGEVEDALTEQYEEQK